MPPTVQLIILALLPIILIAIVGLGILGFFLPAKQDRGRSGRQLTKRSAPSTALQDFAPVFDNSWPELSFEMDVGTTRFAGVVLLFLALFIGLLAGISVNSARNIVVNIIFFAFPIILLIFGCVTLLSSLPQWQSRIVLEAERLVVYPTFRRSPRVVNYDQICYVGAGKQHFTRLVGALIRYYPLDYGGQVDVTRMCQMGLPSTAQNEGLRLVLQARIAGPPIDRTLELALVSKSMTKRFALFSILFGIVLLAIVLRPESRERVLLIPLGLLEIGLLLTVIVMVWPVRRE
jgi:hypothetical protein